MEIRQIRSLCSILHVISYFLVIPRTLHSSILALSQEYPVLTLIGPRQAGKTMLVKTVFSNHAYVNLEHPEQREFAQLDPKGFFARFPGPLILDEIQRVPKLLSYIQVMVDEDSPPSRFVLTGSHQEALQESISQSLAGRTVVLTLLSLSLAELQEQA